MKIRCPICGVDIDIELSRRPEAVGGLAEVIIIHRGHCFKIYLDDTNFVRRTSPAFCTHVDELAAYINGDTAVVIERGELSEIPGHYVRDVVEMEVNLRKWGTKR